MGDLPLSENVREVEVVVGQMERVATDPREGDVAHMRGGYVDYRVTLRDKDLVVADRVQVTRGGALDVKDCRMSLSVWGDLVQQGASTIETNAPEVRRTVTVPIPAAAPAPKKTGLLGRLLGN